MFSDRIHIHERCVGAAGRWDPDGPALSKSPTDLLLPLSDAAREAGEAILEIVRRGFEVETKSDQSPVTEADRAAEAVILTALREVAQGIPVIAEEEVAA